MNLLLTSAGFTNNTISNALHELTKQKFNKPLDQLKLVFIPTAANAVEGDKDWLITDLSRTHALHFQEMDILDFTGVPQDVWEPRIRNADLCP